MCFFILFLRNVSLGIGKFPIAQPLSQTLKSIAPAIGSVFGSLSTIARNGNGRKIRLIPGNIPLVFFACFLSSCLPLTGVLIDHPLIDIGSRGTPSRNRLVDMPTGSHAVFCAAAQSALARDKCRHWRLVGIEDRNPVFPFDFRLIAADWI